MSNSTPIREVIAPGLIREWEVLSDIWSGKTKHQQVDICRTHQGVTLFCDYERQSSEMTQLIYHEAQVYPAIFHKKWFRNALILGSSEGVVTQLLQPFVAPKQIVHVDIDEECVNLCARHLPYGYTTDDVDRLVYSGNLIFEDGLKFLEKNHGLWDLIVMDLPDETESASEASDLYSIYSLKLIHSRLSDDGIFITQAGCATAWRNETLKRMWTKMKEVFVRDVCPERLKIWNCPEHEWAWMLGFRQTPLNPSLPSDKELWPKTIYQRSAFEGWTTPDCLLFHDSRGVE